MVWSPIKVKGATKWNTADRPDGACRGVHMSVRGATQSEIGRPIWRGMQMGMYVCQRSDEAKNGRLIGWGMQMDAHVCQRSDEVKYGRPIGRGMQWGTHVCQRSNMQRMARIILIYYCWIISLLILYLRLINLKRCVLHLAGAKNERKIISDGWCSPTEFTIIIRSERLVSYQSDTKESGDFRWLFCFRLNSIAAKIFISKPLERPVCPARVFVPAKCKIRRFRFISLICYHLSRCKTNNWKTLSSSFTCREQQQVDNTAAKQKKVTANLAKNFGGKTNHWKTCQGPCNW
jgi:hypothetical protein